MQKKYIRYYEGIYKVLPIKPICTITVFIIYHLVSYLLTIFNLFYKGKKNGVSNQRDTYTDEIKNTYNNLLYIRDYEVSNITYKRKKIRDLDLSIIIPCYNSEKYLRDCLLSILRQETLYHFEIIVINDGSTDETANIINSFKDNKKVIVINQINQGMSAARNAGLEIARGKYLTFVDSDDLLAKGALEICLRMAFAENLDILEGNYKLLKNNKLKSMYSKKDFFYEIGSNSDMDFFLSIKSYAWGKFYYHTLWNNVNFPVNMVFQDTIICQIIIRKARRYRYTNQTVCYYRIHKKSITNLVKCHGKSLDSLYLIDYIIKENLKLELPQDSIHYHLLLKQMGDILYQRLRSFDSSILEDVLLVLKNYLSIMEPFRPLDLDPYEQILIKSIKTQDLRTWAFISSI